MNDKSIAVRLITLLLLFICCFYTTDLNAQTAIIGNRKIDSMRLRYLNEQYIQSWIRSDTNTYNHLLWDKNFVHLGASKGRLIPRVELSPIFGEKRFATIKLFYADSVEIRFISDSIAFVYAVTPYAGFDAETISYSRYNDVYLKGVEGWKCIAANTANIAPDNYILPEIANVPVLPWPAMATYQNQQEEESNVMKLNRKWVNAFALNDMALIKNDTSAKSWITYPDGSLDKGSLTMFNSLHAITYKHDIINEVVFFPRKDFAVSWNVLKLTKANGKISALQLCNYYFYEQGKWKLVSFNAVAIQD